MLVFVGSPTILVSSGCGNVNDVEGEEVMMLMKIERKTTRRRRFALTTDCYGDSVVSEEAKYDRGRGLDKRKVIVVLLMAVDVVDNGELR